MGQVNSKSYTYGNPSGSSYTETGSYNKPDYVTNGMDNNAVMDGANTKYASMVRDKNSFLGAFYSKYAAMFSGSTISDITEIEPTSATYSGKTTAYKNSGITTDASGYNNLIAKSDEVQKKRLKMDADISRLSSSRNLMNKNDPAILYNAHFYVNLLWIILATTLIYYIFTEL